MKNLAIFLTTSVFTINSYAQKIWVPAEPQPYEYSPAELDNSHTHSYDAQKVADDFNNGINGENLGLRLHTVSPQQVQQQNKALMEMGHMPSKQTSDQQL